jgi:hypothetical protein
MGIAHKARMSVLAAFTGLIGIIIPAGQATASDAKPESCAISRWDYPGGRMCGPHTWMDVDWDLNGSNDETFVIAPNREIWHIWANSNGWKEMPGEGRADTFHLWARFGSWRCVAVWAGTDSWNTIFDNGKWHGWTRGAC